MKTCGNCSARLSPNAKFCAECGTPVKSVCPSCNEVSDTSLFCSHCGHKMENVSYEDDVTTSDVILSRQARTLTISRERQWPCALLPCKVIINGNYIGNLAVGKTIKIEVFYDRVEVELKIFAVKGIKMALQLSGENPAIAFKVVEDSWYEFRLEGAVCDAKVLEQLFI